MTIHLMKQTASQVIILLSTLLTQSRLLIVLGSSLSCADDEFQCHTLHCIPMAAHCNGIIDCMDHSDEADCGQPLFYVYIYIV